MYLVVAKKFDITSHQLCLAYCREELALFHAVELCSFGCRQMEFTATAGHSSGRDQDNLNACTSGICHLIYQSRHTSNIQSPILAGEDITSDFYGDAFIWHRAI